MLNRGKMQMDVIQETHVYFGERRPNYMTHACVIDLTTKKKTHKSNKLCVCALCVAV